MMETLDGLRDAYIDWCHTKQALSAMEERGECPRSNDWQGNDDYAFDILDGIAGLLGWEVTMLNDPMLDDDNNVYDAEPDPEKPTEQFEVPERYAIVNIDNWHDEIGNRLYWDRDSSDGPGWVTAERASLFDLIDIRTVRLPDAGAWVPMDWEPEEVT